MIKKDAEEECFVSQGKHTLAKDKKFPSTGRHGIDISSRRMDELDVSSLQFVLQKPDSLLSVLDLGGGIGAQSLRFASLGCEVTLVDFVDRTAFCEQANQLLSRQALQMVAKNFEAIDEGDLPREIHVLYSQRSLHYLRFWQAVALMKMVSSRMPVGAKAFLSVSGLNSELGEDYRHRDVPVEERYTTINSELASRHQIHEPVCLYTVEDLRCLACHHAGLFEDRVFCSEFGNIKGVFSVR